MMNHPEGQSQPRLRLMQPLKRMAEGILRRQNKGSISSWSHDPLLTLNDQDSLKAYNPLQDPIVVREREKRAKEPKADLGTFEEWLAYVDLRERLEQERMARGDTEIDYSQLPWKPQAWKPGEPFILTQPQPLSPSATSEERRERDLPIVRKLHTRMAKEAYDVQFDLIAESIQQKIWKANPSRTLPIVIKPSRELQVNIKDDGTVINRSRFGASISYAHRDNMVHIPQAGELTFGIGYVTDRAQIIPEAQGDVSDEDLQTGVKVYFVKRTYAFKETYISAIPLSSHDAQHTFFEYLYQSAKLLAPEKHQVKSYRRNKPQAAAA